MRVLSIDWDYFFPDIAWYDWGHRESEWFVESSWMHRCGNHNILTGERALETVNPDEKLIYNFWNKRVQGSGLAMLVSESHATMYHWLKDWTIDELVCFDQHHDLGYPSAKGELDCGNWAGKMLNERRIRRYTLVYPPWRKNKKNRESKMPKRKEVAVHYDANEVPRQEYDAIHICRSGAWTPSWCDKEFNRFVEFWIQFPIWQHIQFSQYNPMVLRSPNREDAKRLADEYEERICNMEALNALKEEHEERKKQEEAKK
jgi:hypothetical protein